MRLSTGAGRAAFRGSGAGGAARQPLDQLAVAGRGALDDLVGQARAACPCLSQLRGQPVAHDLLVEARQPVGAAGGVERRRPSSGELSLVSTSSARVSTPVAGSSPNSNLVSARMTPRASAIAIAAAKIASEASRSAVARRRADELDGALEGDVLVVLAQRRLARGRVDRLGQAVAVVEAGGQRDAAHGLRLLVLGPAAARRGSRARRTRSGTCRGVVTSIGAVGDLGGDVLQRASRWFGTSSWSNHQRLSWVSSAPLPGMPGSSTWSNALTRSLATMSTRSGAREVGCLRDVEVAHLARVDVRPARQVARRRRRGAVAHDGRLTRAAMSVRYWPPSSPMRLDAPRRRARGPR